MHTTADIQQQRAVGAHLLDRIGHTPLLRLDRIAQAECPQVSLYAKAEWENPGGSVKDRPALRMIEAGERTGALTPGKVILDATSGNTGIAYAMIGAVKGYAVTLCIPSNVSEERKRILQAYGAELIYTTPLESTDGAIKEAQRMYAEDPERYFFPDQYNNAENWRAHYEGTGVEIWEQTQGTVTHFIAGMGTTGSIMGTGRRLKTYNAQVQIISVEPDSPFHGLEGLKLMSHAIVPGIYQQDFPDAHVNMSTETAYRWVKRVAHAEGILIGPSGGANLAAAVRLAKELESGTIVTLFPDSGHRYLSDRFWDEQL